MNEKLIVQLTEIILAIAALGGIAVVLAATWYDMRMVAKKARLQAIISGDPKAHQPSFTVLVYAHNNVKTIEACLESITTNSYSNYKVVVIDNASDDTTMQVITRYKKSHPKIPITVRTLKQGVDRVAALRAEYKRTSGSDFVAILDAADQLSNSTLSRAAALFTTTPSLDAIRTHRQFSKAIDITSLPAHFATLSENILRKALARHAVACNTTNDSGVIVRGSFFTSDAAALKVSATYDSLATFTSAHPFRRPAPSVWQLPIMLGLVILLLVCIALISYFFHTAATLRSNALLTISWSIVSLWLLAAIWLDEAAALSRKISLTFTLPFMYFLLYATLFVAIANAAKKVSSSVTFPNIIFKNIHKAILQEAYSTRF